MAGMCISHERWISSNTARKSCCFAESTLYYSLFEDMAIGGSALRKAGTNLRVAAPNSGGANVPSAAVFERDEGPRAFVGEARARPRAEGKFLFVGGEKLYVRGVSYGTFRGPDGSDFPACGRVLADFAQMAEMGVNTVRTYTVPPAWLLDAAADRGLYVYLGIPWEQHVAFLSERKRARAIEDRVAAAVSSVAGHPAVLCYAIGNETPASIVRWHGARRVVEFLERLSDRTRREDPGALVTYANYPSTEYLELPFLDLVSFNVYIENAAELAAYLARLQNISGDRPLMLSELGLDSRRNGPAVQGSLLADQLRETFAAGAAGTIAFAWTDEWHRGGHDVDDWDVGL